MGTALVEGTITAGVNEARVARGIATAVIDGTTKGAGEVMGTDVVMEEEKNPTYVEIVGVKESIKLIGFVGKRGITGVATIGVPVDAKTIAATYMLGEDRFGDAFD